MTYNFNEIINRENTDSVKFDINNIIFGTEDLLSMWVADMDFKTPPFIVDAIKKRAEHEIYGYSVRPDSFFQSVMDWMCKRHNWKLEKDWINFSPGVVPALNLLVLAFTNPGDKIIVQTPVYFPFFTAIEDNGRVLVNNQLINDNGNYSMDLDDLESKIDKDVKMIFLCNPHNPCGRVWTEAELLKFSEICIKNNILIISDEIHSDLIFSGNKHIPLATLSEEVANKTITLMAPSKTFNTAGLSTSLVITSNSNYMEKYNKMLETIHVGGGNIFGTVALEAAYKHGEEWLEELLVYLQGNIDFIDEYLKKYIPQIKMVKPEATYLVWLDCSALGMEGEELWKFMIEKAKLGFVNGLMFGSGGEKFQRMNIACPGSVIEEAMTRLKGAVDTLRE